MSENTERNAKDIEKYKLACVEFEALCKRIMQTRKYDFGNLYYDLDQKGMLILPASINHHGNGVGGLIIHSCAVATNLRFMTHRLNLKWQDSNSPEIIGFFHDLCKLDTYTLDLEGNMKYKDQADYPFGGHGMKSLVMILRHIRLTDEEMFCIRFHMGAYEKDEWKEFDQAIAKYPNVLWTHTADMAATKIDQK